MGAVCCREDSLDLDAEVNLSHFVLLRSVGKGAFGKVRVVQHKGSKELYALKYINKNKCIQMRAVENIISERRILEQVSHGLIVNLRYAFQDDENLFMVLDLMLGGDLRFHLDRLGVMPESYVQFYCAEVALGLRHLHKHNVVHRDIKPDNILLNAQGHAHLTDFNIAVQFNESRPLTSVAGSMAYMAPEVLLKRGYFASVDWWSLGVVCYELLFGKRPFRGKTNEALQHAILHEPLCFPEGHNVSAEAIDVIKGLLTRDINRRLGVKEKGFQQLVSHPWFKDIQWELLETKQAVPPFIPDHKRANFDPTHELEEILLEDNPLTVRKRNPKRSGTHANSSLRSQSLNDIAEMCPERQIMEDKFLTFDFTKPEENEMRRKEYEQRRWAQRMAKMNRGEKQGMHSLSPSIGYNKAASTHRTSVVDYWNQKPAGDVVKMEELSRMARPGVGKDRGTDWRPPSGILPDHTPETNLSAVQERDHYIAQAGGALQPPPPLSSSVPHHRHAAQMEEVPATRYRRRSSDGSYTAYPSPGTSERPLVGTATSSLASTGRPDYFTEDVHHRARIAGTSFQAAPPSGPLPPVPGQTDDNSRQYHRFSRDPSTYSTEMSTPFTYNTNSRSTTPATAPVMSSTSSLSLKHYPSNPRLDQLPPPPLPPPTSLPPPVPSALPPLPNKPIPVAVPPYRR